LKKDMKYRTLDTTLPRVQQGLLGYEGVLEFLQKLGFQADASMTKLCIEADQPPESVIRDALTVIEEKIRKFEHQAGNMQMLRKIKQQDIGAPQPIQGRETNGGVQNAEADADPDEFTLNQLVTFITLEEYRDEDAHKVIILCHKTFTTSIQLLTCLRTRFFLHRNVSGDSEERIAKRGLKVGKVLTFWLKNYWVEDFHDDSECSEFLEGIINEMQSDPLKHARSLGANLEKLINRMREEAVDNARRKSRNPYDDIQIPASFELKDQPAELLADQLSIIDQELFFEIKPRECLNQNWKKKNNKTLAPNIIRMIDQFNHVCKWIQIEILLCKTLKERGKFIKKAIRMAKRCMDNQNYNALCAINTALNAAPIFRLTHAWNLVKKAEIKVFEQIKELFSHHKNQKNLRAALRNATSPSIPHIGIFLQDLVFIDDGNDSMRKDLGVVSKTINLNKCNRLHERICFMKKFQSKSYTFNNEPQLRAKFGRDFAQQESMTEDQLWNISTATKNSDAESKKSGFFGRR